MNNPESRRVFLVGKLIDVGLTPEEDEELDRLQKEAGRMQKGRKPCQACSERWKTWSGSEPKCAFVGEFADNWNCATVNAIRRICDPGQETMPDGVDNQYCDGQNYATIKTYEIEADERPIGYALWVTWYKSRGRTEGMWILDSHDPPRIPTECELRAIAKAYGTLES